VISRREELELNLRAVEAEVASYQPTLIVVTKTYPVSDVEILRSLGASHFGENRSSEGLEKASMVDATWHYQGEIQSKKIREILQWADCIHSLDNLAHAEKIARAVEGGETQVFLQLSLDGDPSRGGVLESEIFALAESVMALPGLSLQGIMSVPPVEMPVLEAFDHISRVHRGFKERFPKSPYLSAGMSGDYMVALDHGATHIRVGSKILGARHYDR
jgi:pyridoxal phosphate enzyme (YggS family)